MLCYRNSLSHGGDAADEPARAKSRANLLRLVPVRLFLRVCSGFAAVGRAGVWPGTRRFPTSPGTWRPPATIRRSFQYSHRKHGARGFQLYTALMALAFKILGFTYSAALVLTLLNAALVGIGAALLPVLSLKVFGYTAPGIVAGILVVVSGRLMPEQEVALSAALLVSTTLVLMICGRFASGASVAASILTNPVSVLPLVVIMIHRGGRWFAAAGGLALLFCLPWIVRNYLVLGAPFTLSATISGWSCTFPITTRRNRK